MLTWPYSLQHFNTFLVFIWYFSLRQAEINQYDNVISNNVVTLVYCWSVVILYPSYSIKYQIPLRPLISTGRFLDDIMPTFLLASIGSWLIQCFCVCCRLEVHPLKEIVLKRNLLEGNPQRFVVNFTFVQKCIYCN